MRVPLPLLTAALALVGALASTVSLYLQADRAVATMLDQRLTGAGNAAALMIGAAPQPSQLRALMEAESLDGAFLLDSQLKVLADTNGPSGRTADLLRVDPDRVAAALEGSASIGGAYAVGGVAVRTGYFPVRSQGVIAAVLGLEAGSAFAAAARPLPRALGFSVLLAVVGAIALGLLGTRQVRAERARLEALAKAARADLLAQIASAAAHEIRNPLGVIRGTVELMQERSGAAHSDRDRAALSDVLQEVGRLRQLTEDLLDLSADRPLAIAAIGLEALLRDSVNAAAASFPAVRFELSCAPTLPPIEGDAGRLRQVLLNLLRNGAQAAPAGTVTVTAGAEASGMVRIEVADDGPGISLEVAARLFEPFVTARVGGTGLGLAVSRRFVERHGGTLRSRNAPKGAVFELVLPAAR